MGETYIKIVLPLKYIHLDSHSIQCKTLIVNLQSSLGDNPPSQSIIIKSALVKFNSHTPSLNISARIFPRSEIWSKTKVGKLS